MLEHYDNSQNRAAKVAEILAPEWLPDMELAHPDMTHVFAADPRHAHGVHRVDSATQH